MRVKACALNRLDIWQRIGPPRVKVSLPHISGSDISGVVEEVPPGEKELQKGCRGHSQPGRRLRAAARSASSGKDNQCRYYGIIGSEFDGGYAELVSVPRRNVVPKPERMDFVQAASVPLVFLTAHHMLVEKAAVRARRDRARARGRVRGRGRRDPDSQGVRGERGGDGGDRRQARKAVELGADSVVNHNTQDIVQESRKYTGGQRRGRGSRARRKGHVGQEHKSVAKGGRIVICGATTGFDAETDLRYIYSKEISILAASWGAPGNFSGSWSSSSSGGCGPSSTGSSP